MLKNILYILVVLVMLLANSLTYGQGMNQEWAHNNLNKENSENSMISLSQALDQLEEKYEVSFIYEMGLLNDLSSPSNTGSADNFGDELLKLLEFHNLMYSQVNNRTIADKLSPAESVMIDGEIGKRLDESYKNRILAQNVDRLVEPFRHHDETSCWQSEFWGKWFTSAVLAYRYRPEPQLKETLDDAVKKLIDTQTPDGYIGNYAEQSRLDRWDIWGRKYSMLGLLAYYDLTQNIQTLEAASRLADHLINELSEKDALIVRKGSHRGMAATSVLEPIVLLYSRTGEERYLDFAKEIIRQWETSDGPQLISKADVNVAERFPIPENWWGWDQGQKAYEMMSNYEGLLELYRITGNEEYKIAVEKTWENINETEISVAGSGSSSEAWFGGKQLQVNPVYQFQETCVTATWIKLSQQLLRLTGESKYADAVERAWYNALLGSMSPHGSDWAYYSPLIGHRQRGPEQCDMGLNCCTASGPRGLFKLPLNVVMQEENGVQINYYAEGSYQLKTPAGNQINVVQVTNYPAEGDVRISIASLTNEEQFSLKLRIPEWSKQNALKVNDQLVKIESSGMYVEINRVWKPGDELHLELDMRGRVDYIGENPRNMVIFRGPIVLARDARLGGPDVDEPIYPVVDRNGYIDLQPGRLNQDGIWMSFMANFTIERYGAGRNEPISLLLIDYASAGNTFEAGSRFRVWIPQAVNPRTW